MRSLFFVPYILICLMACGLCGCATLGRDSQGQAVWVRSDPPGADIEVAGKVVGQTPLYVTVPRRHRPSLYLSRDGVEKEVNVATKYRWQASFLSNLVFLIYAPAGWAIDLLTGRAWSPQDPPVISLRRPGDQRSFLNPPIDVAAVAPPEADSLAMSNAVLPILKKAIEDRRLETKPTYSVLPFESTLSLFLKRGYDFDGHGSYDDERMLYARLDAAAVWRSKLTSTNDGLHLDAILIDKSTQNKIDELHIVTDPENGLSETYEKGRRVFGLPNAVTASLSTQTFVFNRGTFAPVTLSPVDDDEWWERGLSYLSAISITNIPVYRPGRSGRWQFSVYPVLKLSHRTLIAKGAPDVEGQTFSRWLVGVGAGPELGYQIERSYIYANVFVNGAWSQIDWRFNGKDSSLAKISLLVSTEIGYLYSLNDYLSLRGFVSTSGENADIWKQALSKTSNAAFPYTGQDQAIANISVVGISLGFTFEPFLVRSFRQRTLH